MMRRALWQVQPLPTQKRSATALRPANRGCELPYILNLFNMLVDMAKFRKEQFPMQRAANGSYDHPKKAGNFKVSADAYKVSAQDWDQIGDDADYLLSAPTNDGGMGFSDAYIVELIIAAIRWIYCDQVNDNLSDLWLLNGAFLKRTIKALQVIKTIIPQSEFDSLLEFIPFKP
jgi:hypothetical protein